MKWNEIHGETQSYQPTNNAKLDLSAILGTWINSSEKTEWIKKYTITQEGDRVFINVYGADSPEDWGKVEVTTFVDNLGQTAFHAQYNLDGVEPLLAANMNKGLCVVAAFLKFKDGDRPNFLCREFYYKLDE
ncbi:hypothetical protein [Moorena sp. SIO2C4]|uniref:hypothetical protein n=1 Tax=Moorena sp. SIO2C4 TaxID=2607824 RepID=UPI0013CB42DE|nr:hypothetical protein [Moorena sp. SIO2C4]NES41330.1 hypothetical protein [Moorena sp. SIO2C4]